MCKVMIMGGIKKDNVKNAWRFVHAMAPHMSKGNIDGIGYAAVDSEGGLYGQRWWHNYQFMKKPSLITEAPDKLKQYDDLLTDVTSYTTSNYHTPVANQFGKINHGDMVAITLHTRMATSGKEFANTHPFVYPEKDISLIHNGIISNSKEFDLKVSTCDSEAILISYLKNEVNLDSDNILKLAGELSGYFMCGVFARDDKGERVLDLFKHNARLFASYIKELDTVVFSTSDDDIKTACEDLGFTYTKPKTVADDFLVRMNPVTGELIKKVNWVYPEKKSKTQTYTKSTTTSTGESKSGWMQRTFEKKSGSMSPDMFQYFKLDTTLYRYTEIETHDILSKIGAKNA